MSRILEKYEALVQLFRTVTYLYIWYTIYIDMQGHFMGCFECKKRWWLEHARSTLNINGNSYIMHIPHLVKMLYDLSMSLFCIRTVLANIVACLARIFQYKWFFTSKKIIEVIRRPNVWITCLQRTQTLTVLPYNITRKIINLPSRKFFLSNY